jgi:hypothetical protein
MKGPPTPVAGMIFPEVKMSKEADPFANGVRIHELHGHTAILPGFGNLSLDMQSPDPVP